MDEIQLGKIYKYIGGTDREYSNGNVYFIPTGRYIETLYKDFKDKCERCSMVSLKTGEETWTYAAILEDELEWNLVKESET